MKPSLQLLSPLRGAIIGVVAIGAGMLTLVSFAQEADSEDSGNSADEHAAYAMLRSCDNPWGPPLGSVFLREQPSSEGVKLVDLLVRVRRGMEAKQHAIHIHETGMCIPCSAANGHFDPGPNSNSSPDGNHPYHAGDLTNLTIGDEGYGHLMTVTSRVTLSEGPLSVFDEDGSAVIVHVDPDTYCPDGEAAGCAGGARAACGVIQPYPPTLSGGLAIGTEDFLVW